MGLCVELRELSLSDGRDIFDMLREIGAGENGFGNSGYDIDFDDFAAYLQKQVDMSRGLGIDLDRYVPQTRYWLIVDGRPVGVGKLRHYLNEHLMMEGGHIGYSIRPSERGNGYGTVILSELLKKAREMGISEVLVTCREDNVLSRKVIERNGGVLEGYSSEGRCRYWIRGAVE